MREREREKESMVVVAKMLFYSYSATVLLSVDTYVHSGWHRKTNKQKNGEGLFKLRKLQSDD